MLLLFPFGGMSQVVDNFSDLDFTNDPTWEGTPGHFIVNVDSVLQLRNTAPTGADISFLSTQFAAEPLADKEWQFWIRQNFAGSANNYGQVWLVGNETDPTTMASNGYFLQFGEAGSNDAIELFYSNNGSTTSVCRGTEAFIASGFSFRVRVRRDASGLWSIAIDATGGHDFVPHASGTHTTLTTTDHMSVLCKYTSSNADKFYYDDFYFGDFIVDVSPPELLSLSPLSETQLDVRFSEAVSATTAQNTANYTADGGLNTPVSAMLDGSDATLVHLTFGTDFINGTAYNLTVSNVEDATGNVMVPSTRPFTYVVTAAAAFRDVVINEFMCDPSPPIGLADAEFVELFNPSNKYIDLTGWKLGDASGFGTIGSHIIAPQEYAVLIPTGSAADLAFYPNIVTVTSFPSLNNAGDDIILMDAGGSTIDALSYDLSWYKDKNKESGGYSIEQINPFASCTDPSNWSGSTDPLGGTPAAQNSVFDTTPDTLGPTLTGVTILSAYSLQVQLNESLDAASVGSAVLLISPALDVLSTTLIPPQNSSVLVALTTPIDTGTVYTLNTMGIADCEGNLQDPNSTISFVLPFDAQAGNFIINEVLFDPFTGGSDYVELVNVTDRLLNLKGWMLANYVNDKGIGNQKTIVASDHAVEAGGYVLITADTAAVMMNYIQHGINNFIQTAMPSYNNDSGTVYLLTPDSLVSEYFSYSADMHFPLLSSVDGVSLERLDMYRSVHDKGNWHSAAQTVGFGTPGIRNSQFYPTSNTDSEVSTDPEIFSPFDGDGYNDVLNINYNFSSPGFVATIRIHDANGRPVKDLITNQLLGPSGTFTWDGTTNKNDKARIGMYVILFEAFNDSGDKRVHKLTTVLGGTL